MTLQVITADDDAAQLQQGVVDVVTSFATDADVTHLMQPADGSFHDSSVNAQAAAARCVSTGQDRFDAALAQLPATYFRVIGPISLDTVRVPAR